MKNISFCFPFSYGYHFHFSHKCNVLCENEIFIFCGRDILRNGHFVPQMKTKWALRGHKSQEMKFSTLCVSHFSFAKNEMEMKR
jgi:hypothetical protein